jgi:hypothetical protein
MPGRPIPGLHLPSPTASGFGSLPSVRDKLERRRGRSKERTINRSGLMRDRYRHSCRKPNASGRRVEPLVENGGWNSAHLRQNEQDRDKLLAPVQEINHLLEELEREATAAQPATRAACPSHHPLILISRRRYDGAPVSTRNFPVRVGLSGRNAFVRAFLFVGVCNYGM